MTPAALPTLWIFEDQLSLQLASLKAAPAAAPVLMVESNFAFRMFPYHPKRMTFLISAMRHFRDELQSTGRTVHYYPLQPTGYRDSISALKQHIKATGSRQFWVVEPSEYHTRAWLETLPEKLGIDIRYFADTLFLTDRTLFADWARSLKSPVMEVFYRSMRKKHKVLMDGDQPIGGKWNLDKLNRRPPPASLLVPPEPSHLPDAITQQVITEVKRRFTDRYGTTENFDYPVTRADAEKHLAAFIRNRLPQFGDYEDAMLTGQPLLFHSLISPLINAGLLAPLQCIRAAEKAYHEKHAPLNAVEGFIRQILGWREYMHGIYWTFMPEYRSRNSRKQTHPLPEFFWTGQTEMNCLKQTLGTVIDRAYSHHIQRLMVICNFATLAGIDPAAVNDWFLAMYIDSHDWVVTPNVIGMGMNSDGGTCATKPYVSTGSYINRMSDYCKGCRYKPDVRTGSDACPYTQLYWPFLDRNRKALQKNPRMLMILKNLDRIEPAELRTMKSESQTFIDQLK